MLICRWARISSYNRASVQTLGLSDSTPRTESRWRALLWPTIHNEGDFDYITRQGFWVCSLVAAVTLVLSTFTGSLVGGVFQGLFFCVGVRERSRVAAIVAFSAYLLSVLVAQRLTGAGFGIVSIIFLALLFANIRGSWLSARWEKDLQAAVMPMRLSETIGDKLADQFPRQECLCTADWQSDWQSPVSDSGSNTAD